MTQQNNGNEGFFGTVRNYIPGMATPETGTQATQENTGYQQGILSYIPGFGGHPANPTGVEGNTQPGSQQQGNTGGYAGDNGQGADTYGQGADNYGSQQQANTYNDNNTGVNTEGGAHSSVPSINDYDSSYQGLGVGSKHSTGKEGLTSDNTNQTDQGYGSGNQGYGSGNQGYGSNDQGYDSHQSGQGYGRDTQNEDALAQQQTREQEEGGGYGNQQQGDVDDGVRGAPIEGEGVKGYAVSAPVGSGDTNVRSNSGEPSGQVSGAHMQYNPEDTDTRDQAGRGTVGRTTGQGDSSFANVKRNIPWGTEHVVSKSSQSHIEHNSTTQL